MRGREKRISSIRNNDGYFIVYSTCFSCVFYRLGNNNRKQLYLIPYSPWASIIKFISSLAVRLVFLSDMFLPFERTVKSFFLGRSINSFTTVSVSEVIKHEPWVSCNCLSVIIEKANVLNAICYVLIV